MRKAENLYRNKMRTRVFYMNSLRSRRHNLFDLFFFRFVWIQQKDTNLNGIEFRLNLDKVNRPTGPILHKDRWNSNEKSMAVVFSWSAATVAPTIEWKSGGSWFLREILIVSHKRKFALFCLHEFQNCRLASTLWRLMSRRKYSVKDRCVTHHFHIGTGTYSFHLFDSDRWW